METTPSIREVVADLQNEIEKARQQKEIDPTPAEEAGIESPVALPVITRYCKECEGSGWYIENGIGMECTACKGTGDVAEPMVPAIPAEPVPLMKANQIRVITPWKAGAWIFDDETVGLNQEPFVTSFGDIIDTMVKGIKDAQDGFMLWFSGEPFDGANETFSLANKDGKECKGGNDYRYDKDGRVGWLCPAMYKYFNIAPQKMYFKCEALKNKRPILGRKLEGIFNNYFEKPTLFHKMMREMAIAMGYHVTPKMPEEVKAVEKEMAKVSPLFKTTRHVTAEDKYYWCFSLMAAPEEVANLLKPVYAIIGINDLQLFVEDITVDKKKFGTIRVETGVYEPGSVFEVNKYGGYHWDGDMGRFYMGGRQIYDW